MTFNQNNFISGDNNPNGLDNNNNNNFNFLNQHSSSISGFDSNQINNNQSNSHQPNNQMQNQNQNQNNQHQNQYLQHHHGTDSHLNAQQQQYLLQMQLQQNQAQLQAQSNGQSQMQQPMQHQKRAYSQIYSSFNHPFSQPTNSSSQPSSQSSDFMFNSKLGNGSNVSDNFNFNSNGNNTNNNNNANTMFDPMGLPPNSSNANGNEFRVSPHSSFTMGSNNDSILNSQVINNNQFTPSTNNFSLPVELQGGVNNIFNRRPSYAADLVNSNHNNYAAKQYQLQLSNINTLNNLNSITQGKSAFFENQTERKNSVDFSALPAINPLLNMVPSDIDQIYVRLDDGLLLNKATNTIITSPDLVEKFDQCSIYFGDFDIALKVVDQLNRLLGFNNENVNDELLSTRKKIDKLLDFLLKQNEDLRSSNHMGNKNYSLILNKNGRLDIISFPKNSNLQLMSKDLIIIEGDRGKDLVMVLKPVIDFKFALFFNYLKKKLHLKSLEFGNSSAQPSRPSTSSNNRHGSNSSNNPKSIINEDENFITLPNKQILRFAKPHELNHLVLKYNDEIMAYRICLNYSASLNLDLIIKNVEFQFDKKKLIIYYYCLQRLDFRGLIKELFKIYKTRIWLCAILPLEKSFKPLLDYELENKNIKIDSIEPIPELDESDSSSTNSNDRSNTYRSNSHVVQDKLPTSDQIYQFNEINEPIYFHSKIFSNLIKMFEYEISHHELFGDRYWFLNDTQYN